MVVLEFSLNCGKEDPSGPVLNVGLSVTLVESSRVIMPSFDINGRTRKVTPVLIDCVV